MIKYAFIYIVTIVAIIVSSSAAIWTGDTKNLLPLARQPLCCMNNRYQSCVVMLRLTRVICSH